MKGQSSVSTELTEKQIQEKLKFFKMQNDNIFELSKTVLFFGERLGSVLLQAYNKKHFNFFTKQLLKISGCKSITYKCPKKNIPDQDYIKGYKDIYEKNYKILNDK